MGLPGNHMPHTSLGILNITLVTRYDVNVRMENTLPGRRPHVNTNIVSIGIELLVQSLALCAYQFHAGINFFGRQIKKASDMAAWNDQGMSRTHLVGIAGTKSQLILE